MNRLEAELRLSVLQAEMRQIAAALDDRGQRVVTYAANVLNLVRTPTTEAPGPLKLIIGGRS